jgi:hypothetical protein
MDKVEFEFPDEIEAKGTEKEPELDIEIEDDTPPEDRGREPIPKEIVKKLEVEVDELDQYSAEAKQKLIQMKKVWHDERRDKERALREQQEALNAAQKLLEENKRMRAMIDNGQKEYKDALKESAKAELKIAKLAY